MADLPTDVAPGTAANVPTANGSARRTLEFEPENVSTSEWNDSAVGEDCTHRSKMPYELNASTRKRLLASHYLRQKGADQDGECDSADTYLCLACEHKDFRDGTRAHANGKPGHELFLDTHGETVRIRCVKCNGIVKFSSSNAKDINLLLGEITAKKTNGVLNGTAVKASQVVVTSKSAFDRTQPSQTGAVTVPKSETTEVGVRELRNLGNTCFYNSVLQCILQTHHFDDYFALFKDRPSTISVPKSVVEVSGEKVEVEACDFKISRDNQILDFHNQVQSAREVAKDSQVVNPSGLFSVVCSKQSRFRGHAKHDAHELLRILVDELGNEEQEAWKDAIAQHLGVPKYSRSPIPSGTVRKAKCYLSLLFRPMIERIFGGSLVQTIRCEECQHVSIRLESFLDLSLPLSVPHASSHSTSRKTGAVRAADDITAEDDDRSNEKERQSRNSSRPTLQDPDALTHTLGPEISSDVVYTLEHAFAAFTRPEVLSGMNAFECSACCEPENKRLNRKGAQKKTVSAVKRVLVLEPPAVLTVHLKRFEQVSSHDLHDSSVHKISTHVQFPEILDLASFTCKSALRVAPGQKKILYSLYGVVSHSGGMHDGGYVAYVKSRRKMEYVKRFFDARPLASSEQDLVARLAEAANLKSTTDSESTTTPTSDVHAGSWFYTSDSPVVATSVNHVLRQEAYILFYERFE